MDRVRVGLTGLGMVFLLTLAGSVLSKPGAPANPAKNGEFLAQLGVVPNSDTSAKSEEEKAPPPEAPPAPDSESSKPAGDGSHGVPIAGRPAKSTGTAATFV